MILGGGLQQLPAVRHAWKLGWHSIVLDGNPEALARWESNAFHNIDLRDTEAILSFAESIHEDEPLDAIFTLGTDFSVPVAEVAKKLSLPGIPVESAMACTNKVLMRKRLQENGLTVPAFEQLSWQETEKEEILNRAMHFVTTHSLPVVIKPADNMGARGVQLIHDEDAVLDALDNAAQYSKELIIEEFIEGQELSIDVLLQKGSFYICGIADRHISLSPYRVELGHSFPTQADSKDVDAAIQVMKRAAQIMNIEDGVLKGDVFVRDGQAVIGEIASRLSGGFMSGWTYPRFSGVEPVEHAMRIAANMPIMIPRMLPKRSGYIVERGIISIPGVFSHLSGCNDAWMERGICNMFLYPRGGETVTVPHNNVEKIGSIIIQGKNAQELEERSKCILSRVMIHLSPSNADTEFFLFGASEDPQLGPSILHATNQRQIAGLQPYDPRLYKKKMAPMPVWNLPELKQEDARDWQGNNLREIIEYACKKKYIRLVPRRYIALGSLFWLAVERGGLQAICYCYDTLHQAHSRKEVLQRWQSFLH